MSVPVFQDVLSHALVLMGMGMAGVFAVLLIFLLLIKVLGHL